MKHRVFNVSLFVVYMVVMTIIMIKQGVGISPDRYVFILLLGSLLVKKTRSFILDWTPFLFILLSYEYLRGLAGNLGQRVNFTDLIWAEEHLFDFIPAIKLQQLFYNPGSPTWYDYVSSIFYFLHFALPLSFGFILWLYNKAYFRQFVTGLLLLSYSAWITFLIYPAAPPWMASDVGYLPKVHKILNVTLSAFPDRWDLPTIYHHFNPNPVASFPSLHAAYPFLVFLFALRFFKLKALPFILYVLIVWISIIYLGEHYVVDVIAGAAFALIFYLISIRLHIVDWGKLIDKTLRKLN